VLPFLYARAPGGEERHKRTARPIGEKKNGERFCYPLSRTHWHTARARSRWVCGVEWAHGWMPCALSAHTAAGPWACVGRAEKQK